MIETKGDHIRNSAIERAAEPEIETHPIRRPLQTGRSNTQFRVIREKGNLAPRTSGRKGFQEHGLHSFP